MLDKSRCPGRRILANSEARTTLLSKIPKPSQIPSRTSQPGASPSKEFPLRDSGRRVGLHFWLPIQHSCWHQQEPVATPRGFVGIWALKQGCKDNHPHCPPSCGAFTQHVLGGVLGGCCSGILYFNHHLQIRSEIRKSCHTRAWKAAAGLGYQHSQPLHIQSFFSFLPAGLRKIFPMWLCYLLQIHRLSPVCLQ